MRAFTEPYTITAVNAPYEPQYLCGHKPPRYPMPAVVYITKPIDLYFQWVVSIFNRYARFDWYN